MAPRICVFAKAPVRGRVKTRLAAGIGADAALRVYLHMLARTAARLSRPGWRTELWVTPDESAADDPAWPTALPRQPQGAGDLGRRMLRALHLARPDAPVVVVGSDIPGLAARHVERALLALRTHPMVFGPSLDGGFYLVGCRSRPPPGLFSGVTWSAPTTLSETLRGCGGAPALIEPLEDLDDLATLERRRDAPDWQEIAALLDPRP